MFLRSKFRPDLQHIANEISNTAKFFRQTFKYRTFIILLKEFLRRYKVPKIFLARKSYRKRNYKHSWSIFCGGKVVSGKMANIVFRRFPAYFPHFACGKIGRYISFMLRLMLIREEEKRFPVRRIGYRYFFSHIGYLVG